MFHVQFAANAIGKTSKLSELQLRIVIVKDPGTKYATSALQQINKN